MIHEDTFYTDHQKCSKEQLTGKLPYTLTNDFFFKAFLQRNEAALRGLLCALLSIKPEEITSVVIINPICDGDVVDDKTVILDLRLILNDIQIINLEMQVENLGDWPERSLTYLCRMFDQLKSGEAYIQVKKTLHIGIVDFTPEGFPEILFSEYFLYNLKNEHKYSDKLGIYMLQLNQTENPENEKNMPEVYYWAKLFKATTWEEIQMLAKKNEVINQSIVTLKELTADEKMRMQMEARERYRRDLSASIAYGKHQSAKLIRSLNDTIAEKDNTIAKLERKIALLEKQL